LDVNGREKAHSQSNNVINIKGEGNGIVSFLLIEFEYELEFTIYKLQLIEKNECLGAESKLYLLVSQHNSYPFKLMESNPCNRRDSRNCTMSCSCIRNWGRGRAYALHMHKYFFLPVKSFVENQPTAIK
jgi:hypothetical protein